MTKVISHRRDAEGAEKEFLIKKPLRALRLCGESYKNDRIPYPLLWKGNENDDA